jgi:hypothetical protein
MNEKVNLIPTCIVSSKKKYSRMIFPILRNNVYTKCTYIEGGGATAAAPAAAAAVYIPLLAAAAAAAAALSFLPYFPIHLTIQLIFLSYFPYLFTIQHTFLP